MAKMFPWFLAPDGIRQGEIVEAVLRWQEFETLGLHGAPLEEVNRMFQKDRCVTFGSRGGPSLMLDKGSWSWWISYVSQADMVRFWAVRRIDAYVDR